MKILIPDLMQHRARLLGDPGLAWLQEVDGRLATLTAAWNLEIERQLSGGTEALVFATRSKSGNSVLKLGIPNSLGHETQVLQRAPSNAYARLLAFDASCDAILLERLGAQLAESSLSMQQQIHIICATLQLGWQPANGNHRLISGAKKAQAQADFIVEQWQALDRPCPEPIIDHALSFASARKNAHDPDNAYLIHGDAHIWNTLAAPAAPTGYKFVDPDGLQGERAIDLAISLREWRDELLGGDTLTLGLQRCEMLGSLANEETQAIWQWGYIEHVSCGLLDLNLGNVDAAQQHFSIASCWLHA